jgi:hypothetical protein
MTTNESERTNAAGPILSSIWGRARAIGSAQGEHGDRAQLARILYHRMRHGSAYMHQEEAAYAEQVRERLDKQLHRRARN